ncbi:MAG TPA: hypothetical protein VHG93_25580 [Longimicrobium sp.]|nr:hypothetical protein [Longimicrobium sp.]
MNRHLPLSLSTAVALAACGEPDAPPPAPLPANSFAFAVFGDGPYSRGEARRFDWLVEEVNEADLAFVHVGDILGADCSDDVYDDRLEKMNSIRHPVVYTPGDNEWTDCYPRGHDPLDRLARIRRTFFRDPDRSLGGRRMPLQTQARDRRYREFRENQRWTRGGFVFATVHLVGSANGTRPFRGRRRENDAEVARRTAAAIAWMDAAFAEARRTGARGVVLVTHANVGIDPRNEPRQGYGGFVDALERQVAGFRGPVVLIHGDTHHARVDHPLRDRGGEAYRNFTRVESYGSPDIGWTRVVVDSVAGRVTAYEPRKVR